MCGGAKEKLNWKMESTCVYSRYIHIYTQRCSWSILYSASSLESSQQWTASFLSWVLCSAVLVNLGLVFLIVEG